MSATTTPTTFSDLYTDLQNRVRVTTGVTATENQAKRYINTALMDLHIGFGEKFPWAERDAVLRTQAQYTTGTVAISKGGTALTGTSTAWNTNNDFSVANARVGGKIIIGGNDVYEVTAVGSDTAITLGTAFISTTETAATYTYFEDEYALASDFLRPIDLQLFSTAMEIPLISRTEFRRSYPRNNTPGRPRVATLIRQEPSGDVNVRTRVRFHRPPETNYLIPYTYVTANLAVSSTGTAAVSLSSDTDEPIVPLQYRHVIVLHALYNWYRDKKDDARSAEVKGEWTDLMRRIVGDQEIGASRPRLVPRVSPYKRRAKRPWSGTGNYGRFTTGTQFDEIR